MLIVHENFNKLDSQDFLPFQDPQVAVEVNLGDWMGN